MRVLLDENLSSSLVQHLSSEYDAVHVRGVGLLGRSDWEVWSWARENVAAIISKDSDFADMVVLHGPPPKVIIVQLGNCRTADVTSLLLARAREVERFLAEQGEGLLIVALATMVSRWCQHGWLVASTPEATMALPG